MSSSDIELRPFNREDLSLFFAWVKEEHVRKTWFLQGYEHEDFIHEKIAGNGYDFPMIIMFKNRPIGYLQYRDLALARKKIIDPQDTFPKDAKGAFSFDVFIAEKKLLGQGIGTRIVSTLCVELFKNPEVKRIVVDPNVTNLRAIRCYKKAGFKTLYTKHDGVIECLILEKTREG